MWKGEWRFGARDCPAVRFALTIRACPSRRSLKLPRLMFRASRSATLFSLPLLAVAVQNAVAPLALAAAPKASAVSSSPVSADPPPRAMAKITYSQCHVDGQYIAMTFD